MEDTYGVSSLDEDAVAAVEELRTVREAIKVLEARESEIKASLLETLADADEGINASGIPVVEVRRQTRSSVDTKKLQALYFDVWKDCQRHTVVSSIRLPSVD